MNVRFELRRIMTNGREEKIRESTEEEENLAVWKK
jgi:hypothetical protein